MGTCVVYLFVSVPESAQINWILLYSQQSEILSQQTQREGPGLHVVQAVRSDCSQLAQSHLPQGTAHTHPFLDNTQGS